MLLLTYRRRGLLSLHYQLALTQTFYIAVIYNVLLHRAIEVTPPESLRLWITHSVNAAHLAEHTRVINC